MKSKFLQFIEGYLDDNPDGDPVKEMAQAIVQIKQSIKNLPKEDREAALNQAIKELRDEYKDSVLKEEDKKPDHIEYLDKKCTEIENRILKVCPVYRAKAKTSNPKKHPTKYHKDAETEYTKHGSKNPFHGHQPGDNFEGSAE